MKKLFLVLMVLLVTSVRSQITIDTIILSQTKFCLGDSVLAYVQVSPAGNFMYQWQFNGILGNPSNDSTMVTPTNSGTELLIIEVFDGSGGYATDTVELDIHQIEYFNAFTSDPVIFCGESAQLFTSLNETDSVFIGVGNPGGANTEYTYPAPFANWYANAKQQYLFLASELTGQGITAGDILGINFPVNSVEGLTTYLGYTVTLANTSATDLSIAFLPVGSSNNYFQNTTIQAGNNYLYFSTPFNWNGTDNLVVEICYTWTSQFNYTQNSISPWVNTSFVSSSWYYSDGTPACPQDSAFGYANYRPHTEFLVTSNANFDSLYYSWTPAATLDNAAISNPVATATIDTWYYVNITDSVCSATDSVFIDADSSITVNSYELISGAICENDFQTFIASGTGATSYLWVFEDGDIDSSYNDTTDVFFTGGGFHEYTLTAFGNCGNNVSLVDSVETIADDVIFNIQPLQDTFCTNQNINFDASGSYGGGFTWYYEIGGIPQSYSGTVLSYYNSQVDQDTITLEAYSCSGNTEDTTFVIYFLNCLGISENDASYLIQMNSSEIILSNNQNNYSFALYNCNGQLIAEEINYPVDFCFSTKHLPLGIYILELYNKHYAYRKKIVLNP